MKQNPTSQLLKLLSFQTTPQNYMNSYTPCVEYLASLCPDQLKIQILTPVKEKPILLLTWEGRNPQLKKILLNSHYDVVPCEDVHWTHPPFQPILLDNKIIGRGSQDMKCVCIQYLVAIQRLCESGYKPDRGVMLSFVPDEEIGGADGMQQLINMGVIDTNKFEVAFDEGLANPTPKYTLFYGERKPKWIKITAKGILFQSGNVGHGSQFITQTAVSKLVHILQKAYEFRQQQENILRYSHEGCKHSQAKTLGDVTTLNCTYLQAGESNNGKYNINVIPSEAIACFDIRVTPHFELEKMNQILNQWCDEVGAQWESCLTNETNDHYVTETLNNPFFEKLKEVVKSFDIDLEQAIFPAATDSRFLRQIKLPAFGFSPMRNQEILLHQHNEYIKEDVFLEGINVFEKLFKELTSM